MDKKAHYFYNQQLISKDQIQQTFSEIFNCSISKATLEKINKEFYERAIGHLKEQVLEDLKNDLVKGADESGFQK